MSHAAPEELALWLRAALWPRRLRVVLLTSATVAYLAVLALVPPHIAAAMRPLNLFLVLIAGIFFGLRGGAAFAVGLVVVNVTIYWYDGILAGTPAALSGNLLSIVFGCLTGVIVGHVRDLSLRLREQVRLRIEAEYRRDELTALLVHDLKNPLTGIVGHAQLIAEDEVPGSAVESLQYIRSASERMTRMVMNLLDVGRAEDGRLMPRYQKVDVPTLLTEVQAEVQPLVAERSQGLSIIQSGEDVSMEADPDLIRRVLLNLLENAIKYTPRGQQVRVELVGAKDAVELCVRDEGPGIPDGFEEKVFEKYIRLERDAGSAAHFSRGLGLHFCKLAATAHGGRIWVERNQPAGSAFRIRLPRGRAALS